MGTLTVSEPSECSDPYVIALSAENVFAFGIGDLARLAFRTEPRYLAVGAEVLAAIAAGTVQLGDAEREFRARLRRGS